ncbi:peptide ABC transporter ATP-binding protein [Endozoicomonas montiporae]|uniref:Peptide ABC transporter ATP-binding protein n=2 Tax=Endozoicomonas montiporae TaxID=1027273 RepID=A0A081N089_9GAMM|nr:murein tripeptide/oligopeptide ABC transporter ATP binding protein OppF [Endozoicomonas montiporae]AMO54314.1 oligopeptide ABC transporter ATP-binding protein [Endozoicomonas montiporae CL-33]KEQ11862.1 peptide ABC transporter ATP-binding protein [Endozoicomonas montiporae]
MDNLTLLSVRDLKVHFPVNNHRSWPWQKPSALKAVDGISFNLAAGETLGIVGESGCGKSTLARAIIGLTPVTAGEVIWQGRAINGLSNNERREVRRHIQMIFQDPLASLNPRMTIGDIIAEPVRNYCPELAESAIQQQVKAMMDRVGLLPNVMNRYPHEFSGGQCQRVGIARALMLKPKLVICDEPVSALDVSIQAQVINLLQSLQQEMGLALLFIAHDLSVVKHISNRVMVMYLGREMESATSQQLYTHPKHPYTRALLASVPIPDPQLERSKLQNHSIQLLDGDLPSPVNPPSGCVFRTRCPMAEADCARSEPAFRAIGDHRAACPKT